MFVGLNTGLRRQRRRIAVIAAMLTLAGAVVTAHSVTGADHMGDATAMCLAVVETAVIAVGGALIVGLVLARAGPPVLQVFRQ